MLQPQQQARRAQDARYTEPPLTRGNSDSKASLPRQGSRPMLRGEPSTTTIRTEASSATASSYGRERERTHGATPSRHGAAATGSHHRDHARPSRHEQYAQDHAGPSAAAAAAAVRDMIFLPVPSTQTREREHREHRDASKAARRDERHGREAGAPSTTTPPRPRREAETVKATITGVPASSRTGRDIESSSIDTRHSASSSKRSEASTKATSVSSSRGHESTKSGGYGDHRRERIATPERASAHKATVTPVASKPTSAPRMPAAGGRPSAAAAASSSAHRYPTAPVAVMASDPTARPSVAATSSTAHKYTTAAPVATTKPSATATQSSTGKSPSAVPPLAVNKSPVPAASSPPRHGADVPLKKSASPLVLRDAPLASAPGTSHTHYHYESPVTPVPVSASGRTGFSSKRPSLAPPPPGKDLYKDVPESPSSCASFFSGISIKTSVTNHEEFAQVRRLLDNMSAVPPVPPFARAPSPSAVSATSSAPDVAPFPPQSARDLSASLNIQKTAGAHYVEFSRRDSICSHAAEVVGEWPATECETRRRAEDNQARLVAQRRAGYQDSSARPRY
ncbi:uncharacterized protein FIBRA_09178 [Fibroporia radiculosa]|uniref:Uncharacterized protein n=1 Tax=Fibroporia radiculosa TaxID=599839 RepID=J4GY35_9APHY|nr:uncharacterized protein FIBRA_09178 [Fibroporia radiculosa]CCM06870.1 predicted protein [Fibroporia radiculosa]